MQFLETCKYFPFEWNKLSSLRGGNTIERTLNNRAFVAMGSPLLMKINHFQYCVLYVLSKGL